MRPETTLSPQGTARERLLYHVEGRDDVVGFAPKLLEALSEHNLGEEAAYLAWELGRFATGLNLVEQKALFYLVLATIVSLHQGNTRMPVRGGRRDVVEKLFAALDVPEYVKVAERLLDDPRLSPVLGRPGDYRPLILQGDHLYHQRTLSFEDRLVRSIKTRLARPFAVDEARLEAAFADVMAKPPQRGDRAASLSGEQQAAALLAARSGLAVITGGPGTGKTSIVVSVLRLLVRMGVPIEQIALSAPTGKAANRMKAAIAQALEGLAPLEGADALCARFGEPRTLHRLLGYAPSRGAFRHGAQLRLPESVIIVDECSMIDLVLMTQLVEAVRDDARLILLGDVEQLPSVDAGAVFRSLLPPPGAPESDVRSRACARLTHSYRMDAGKPSGRAILLSARAINEGREQGLLDGDAPLVSVRARAADVAFDGAELLASGADERVALLRRWFDERVRCDAHINNLLQGTLRWTRDGIDPESLPRLRAIFAHYEGFRLLSVTRAETGGTGADALNDSLHEMMQRATGQPGELCPGEPVMMLYNDYERELFNGDQGVVLLVDDGHDVAPRVVFRKASGDFAVYALPSLRGQLRLSYAMTVHKAQGSEHDHVMLVLPDVSLPILTREVLYTAVTRARTSAVVVGSREMFVAGVRMRVERFTGIEDKLLSP